jgi:septal ring factor EnvC (AmiA/AmiB activator)
MKLFVRRVAIVTGVAASLLLGVVSIRAAAAWTATSAPPSTPISVASLNDQVAAEQARSAALQAQLDELVARSAELTAALETARGRIAADASAARDLRSRLADARRKLSALSRTLARPVTAPRAVAAAAPAGSGHESDEPEGGDD